MEKIKKWFLKIYFPVGLEKGTSTLQLEMPGQCGNCIHQFCLFPNVVFKLFQGI